MLEVLDARGERAPAWIERPQPVRSRVALESEVREMLDAVRLRGDAALIEYAERSHRVTLSPEQLKVPPDLIAGARGLVRPELLQALEHLAADRRAEAQPSLPQSGLTDDGRAQGDVVRPLRRVGICMPSGGPGRLSTLIATSVAAQVAGVEEVAVCVAPGPGEEIAETTLAACSVVGLEEIYRVGDVAAVAALAFGTVSVRPVDKVVAWGDPMTALAQRSVHGWVGTGPTTVAPELVIVADESASPQLIAADLAANASWGAGGTHAVVSPSQELLVQVLAALDMEVAAGEDSGDVENALIEGGRAVLVRDLDHALATVNAFAPQCLMLAISEPSNAIEKVRSAGAVLLGQSAPASVVSGADFGIAPTGGSARWDSALAPRDFLKVMPVNGPAREESSDALVLAGAEGTPAQQRALQLRRSR